MKTDLDIPAYVKLSLLARATLHLTDAAEDYAERGEDADWPPHADEYRKMRKDK